MKYLDEVAMGKIQESMLNFKKCQNPKRGEILNLFYQVAEYAYKLGYQQAATQNLTEEEFNALLQNDKRLATELADMLFYMDVGGLK